ncbi:hypothetical protein P692DRAFT_20953293 [Suillus brevipes Sb2]|nr:hypothetical protein P692DRAFT_20953293 [Suillus brevipes Sb2]
MSAHAQLEASFFPPLYLQRRIWVLDILCREQVTEIVDIGCGEGQLLAVLCQPAPSLPHPDASTSPSHRCPSNALEPDDLDLSLTPYHGVLSDLSSCVMPQNGPCSTGGIGEPGMPWAHQAWPKRVRILVSVTYNPILTTIASSSPYVL